MECAYARIRLPDGRSVTLFPGDVIGRLWSAALRLEDRRISEAHALLSLRGERLCLLPLRGEVRASLDERPSLRPVVLRAGLRLYLHAEIPLVIESVVLPLAFLAVALPGQEPVPLSASIYSICPGAPLVRGHAPEALGWIWSTGEGWQLQPHSGPSVLLKAGMMVEVQGTVVRVLALPRSDAAIPSTAGWQHTPLRIVTCWDTAHLHREGHPTLSLSRISAKILSVLGQYEKTPLFWWDVMRQIEEFRDEPALAPGVDVEQLDAIDRQGIRQRWDRNLAGLRSKLREAGIISDEPDAVRTRLIRSAGNNLVELVLLPGDQLEEHL